MDPGIVSVNGGRDGLDPWCLRTMGQEECEYFAKYQDTNGTFIDELFDAGYNITLYGKMHVGAGLDRFKGKVNAFPFANYTSMTSSSPFGVSL